ncbi:hypothetical protein ABZ552_32865 [Nocardia sp. NPDC019219]|uniref:DISARM anti-phage system protein DrmE domain-containing protein n=1 Tax=Nocardia sp. NPDC019219 TaxID=3154590 RepID=UPI00341002D5
MSSADARRWGGGGLAGLVLDGTLRRHVLGDKVRRFSPSALDVEVLDVVDAAAASGIPLGLVFPLAGTAAPILVGAASLMNAVRRTGDLRVQGALVGRNLQSRALYDRLYFNDQRLADFLPRTVVDPDEEVRTIGQARHDRGGRLHIVSRLERLHSISEPLSSLVIEGSAASMESVRDVLADPRRPDSIVYVTSNPYDTALPAIERAGGTLWAWSASRVADLAVTGSDSSLSSRVTAGALVADPALLSSAGRCAIEVVTCGDDVSARLDSALEDTWRSLGLLVKVMPDLRVGNHPPEALWWAWGAFNTLAMLPVPPRNYDLWAGGSPYMTRLGDVPRIALEFARNAGGELARAWTGFAESFRNVLATANSGGRWSGVIAWLEGVIDSGRRGVLVASNRAAASAIREALDESPYSPLGWDHDGLVTVMTVAELSAGHGHSEEPPSICLPGPLPRRRAGLYALPPGHALTVVAAGDFDARRSAAQALAARTTMSELEARTETAARTLGLPPPAGIRADVVGSIKIVNSGVKTAVVPPARASLEADGGPWEPFDPDIMATLRRNIDSGVLPRDDAATVSTIRTAGGASTIIAITVHLDHGPDGRDVLVVEPNDLVARRSGDAIERVAAKALRHDDVVLLVDHGARRDLLDTVIERLAETPEYATLQYTIEFWKARAARASTSGQTYAEILRRMQAIGTRVTAEQTLGNWVRGVVDGPRDPADVDRFARAIGDDQLRNHADQIAHALETVHGVHRRAGGWLSRRLAGARAIDEHLVIEGGQKMHVSDLMDAVTTHRVLQVDRTVRAPTLLVGTLVDSRTAARMPTA